MNQLEAKAPRALASCFEERPPERIYAYKRVRNGKRFSVRWKDADPGIPEVENARQRVAGLKK